MIEHNIIHKPARAQLSHETFIDDLISEFRFTQFRVDIPIETGREMCTRSVIASWDESSKAHP